MALTPESLTEQQIQPLVRETHSSTCRPSWEMVRDFSMEAESPNSVRVEGQTLLSDVEMAWVLRAVEYDCYLLAVLLGKYVVEQSCFAGSEVSWIRGLVGQPAELLWMCKRLGNRDVKKED